MKRGGGRRKFALIDGNSLAYRAFFALPPLSTSDGRPTSAVYGFLTMLFRLLEEECPDVVCVAFDKGRPEFRLEEYDGYKAHRPETPDDLRQQMPVLREVLDVLEIPTAEAEGYEADDVLGTLCRMLERDGHEVVLVTGDADLLQLVSGRTRALLTRRGITDIAEYDEAAVRERYGVEPRRLPDLKGLMGDPSDGIPGVPGIGEKTAMKLLKRFGSLEEAIERAADAGSRRVVKALLEHAQQAKMSKRLATIRTDVPLEVDPSTLTRSRPDLGAVSEMFARLEFRSLLGRVSSVLDAGAAGPGEDAAAPRHEIRVLERPGDISRAAAEAARGERVAWHWRLIDDGSARPVPGAVAVSTAGGTWVVRLSSDEEGADEEGLRTCLRAMRPLLESADVEVAGHGLKPVVLALGRVGIEPPPVIFDSELAAYLLDPSRTSYRLADLVGSYLGRDLWGPDVETPDEAEELARRARAVYELRPVLGEELEALGLLDLLRDVELPLIRVLADMEATGIAVDRRVLEEIGEELSGRIDALTGEIHDLAGVEFNINSTKQLAEVLFDKLGLPPVKRTKTGYSTSADVLEELAPRHEIVRRILEYRQLSKLKGTYVDGLASQIDPSTGRIHSRFNQTITATGRLSSAEPNLQNIPVRMEVGRRLRKAFVASGEDRVLLAGDYSQIELRVLAHVSGDPALGEAFVKGEDIHARTASEVFGVPLEEVTSEMRTRAKAVNFGIVYGISDYGLARDLGIGVKEAGEYISSYFDRFPKVKEYLDGAVERARRDGYVTTILNRRRYLREIRSRNAARRAFAERTAMNTPIQGSAADIIKLAMVKVHRELEARGLDSKLVLQVHDELIFDAPEAEVEELVSVVSDAMGGAYRLSVPLVVDVKAGPSWYDMEPV